MRRGNYTKELEDFKNHLKNEFIWFSLFHDLDTVQSYDVYCELEDALIEAYSEYGGKYKNG